MLTNDYLTELPLSTVATPKPPLPFPSGRRIRPLGLFLPVVIVKLFLAAFGIVVVLLVAGSCFAY